MKIWIHTNGVQEGPFDIEELPMDRINSQTPVWYEGLPDWMPISQAPATAHLFGMEPDPAAMADARDRAAQRQQRQSATNSDYATSDPRAAQQQGGRFAALSPEAAHNNSGEPASYLGWSIIMTLLCCNPVAIAAIITGAAVRSKCNAHDYDGARRLSEITAWLVMICIVLTLMFMPVAMILM